MFEKSTFSVRDFFQVIFFTIIILFLNGCSTVLQNGDTFTYKGLKYGSVMTQDYCQDSQTSVWVTIDGKGECIRYFSAGLKNENKIVHVWFHGDRLRTVGLIKDRNVKVIGYHDNSPSQLQQSANGVHRVFKIPYIRFSRPGAYGSSGDHKKRRLTREIEVINAALNELKRRYKISSFILSGQSGGGHIAGSLLSFRNDIACAVITSGVTSVGKRNIIKNWSTDVTGYSSFYDPVKHVAKIRQNAKRPIFIVGDPMDDNVPFSTQKHYYNELIKHKHNAWLIKSNASNHHSLATVGFEIVKMWFEGVSSRKIVESLNEY